MLLPIKAICSKSKIRKDGTSVIFFQYCGAENRRTLLNTEITIPPRYWNRRLCRISNDLPEKYGSPASLNDRLTLLSRKVEDIIGYAVKHEIQDQIAFVKSTFHPDFDVATLEDPQTARSAITKATPVNVFDQFDDFIKTKKETVTPKVVDDLQNAKDLLLAFETYRKKKITFQCFNYDFYDRFVRFLTYDYQQRRTKAIIKGLRRNTVGKTIKSLRLFLRDRSRRNIISPIDLADFKVQEEQTDAIYLSPSEIDRIYKTDLSEAPCLEICRDLLVFACLTGLRFSDFSSIRPEDVKGDMLYKKQQKSNHWVVIPLRPYAYEILVNKLKCRVPSIRNDAFNKNIREVGKLADINELVKFSYKKGNQDIVIVKPKFEWIASHTCRRSFCTNEFLAGTPVELIMKISGHKSLRDFYRYIRISPEEAGQKIKELWAEREAQLSA